MSTLNPSLNPIGRRRWWPRSARRRLADQLGCDVHDPLVREIRSAGSSLAWFERALDLPEDVAP